MGKKTKVYFNDGSKMEVNHGTKNAIKIHEEFDEKTLENDVCMIMIPKKTDRTYICIARNLQISNPGQVVGLLRPNNFHFCYQAYPIFLHVMRTFSFVFDKKDPVLRTTLKGGGQLTAGDSGNSD